MSGQEKHEISFEKVSTGRRFPRWLALASRERGFVTWLASYVHLTRRQLAHLARDGKIPGVVRSANGYNWDWDKDPDGLAAWILDRRRFRKGKRKSKPKRKKKPLTELDRLESAFRRLNAFVYSDTVQTQLRRAPEDRLRRLEALVLRTSNLISVIDRVRKA